MGEQNTLDSIALNQKHIIRSLDTYIKTQKEWCLLKHAAIDQHLEETPGFRDKTIKTESKSKENATAIGRMVFGIVTITAAFIGSLVYIALMVGRAMP